MTPEKSADLANPPRRIAIIGGGVTGLTAAYDLTRAAAAPGGMPGPSARPQVTIYEHGAQLGGLAGGFKGRESWEWPLEHFYHHLFLSDKAMLGLLDEIGFRAGAQDLPAQHGHSHAGRQLSARQRDPRAAFSADPIYRPAAHGDGDRLPALSSRAGRGGSLTSCGPTRGSSAGWGRVPTRRRGSSSSRASLANTTARSTSPGSGRASMPARRSWPTLTAASRRLPTTWRAGWRSRAWRSTPVPPSRPCGRSGAGG